MVTTRKLTIRDANGKARILQEIEAREDYPFRVAIADGEETRSQAQNALQWKWATEVAKQKGDEDADEIQSLWKLLIGVPILREEDETFALEYCEVLDMLTYEKQLSQMKYLKISSLMTVKQMTKYLNKIQRACIQNGYAITDPEALKYESEMR